MELAQQLHVFYRFFTTDSDKFLYAHHFKFIIYIIRREIRNEIICTRIRSGYMTERVKVLLLLSIVVTVFISPGFAQPQRRSDQADSNESGTSAQQEQPLSNYMLDNEDELKMIVHIWGEVRNPGEMIVPYETNILELISKAGGPTQYANLTKVRLTRDSENLNLTQNALKSLVTDTRTGKMSQQELERSLKTHYGRRIQVYNVKDYLENKDALNPPIVLKPVDVIYVPNNGWHKWREIVRVAHEVAVIASVYVWYLRSKNW